MSKSNHIALLIVFILFISSCQKEKNQNIPFVSVTGKLKKMTTYNSISGLDSLTFIFYYDSTSGYLTSAKSNNREYINIYQLSNDLIKVEYDLNAPLSIYDSNATNTVKDQFIVHIDNKRRIYKITYIDTITSAEINSVNYYADNNKLDSIISSNKSYRTWDYEYFDENIVKFARYWKPIPIFSATQDTLTFQYSGILNDGKVPMQHISYPFGGVNFGTDLLYILGLNGYYAYKPNKNLISNITIYDQSGSVSNTNRTYTINSIDQVVQETIYIDTESVRFNLEYY